MNDPEAKKVITLKQLNPKLKQAVIRSINFKQIPEQQNPTSSKVLKLSKVKPQHQAPRTLPKQPTERVQ